MKKVSFLVVFTTLSLCALAQVTTNEQPYGLQQRSIGQNNQSPIALLPPNVRQLAIEDSIREQSYIETEDSTSEYVQGGGVRFAYPVWVNYTPENSGLWEQLPNGDKIWRLKIKIPDALSLHTYYDRFWLPEGGKFFVYSEETGQSIGAITSGSKNSSKENPLKFATGLIYGEGIVYEYYQPAYVKDTAIISIYRIEYGYRYINNPYQKGHKDFGDALSCHNDICNTSNYQNERHAVTKIIVPFFNEAYTGTKFFSGALINTTNNDNTPYVLTTIQPLCSGLNATGDADASDWMFYWDYTSCDSLNLPPTIGATIVANGDFINYNGIYPNTFEVDFALLLLNDDPQCEGISTYWLGYLGQ